MRELAAQKSVPHRDFYNVRKVSIHLTAASMYIYVYMYVSNVQYVCSTRMHASSHAVALLKQ